MRFGFPKDEPRNVSTQRFVDARDTVESHHPAHGIPLNAIVEVEWIDSERIFLGWNTAEEYSKALADRTTYRTSGYLANVNSEYVLVVMNRSDSGMIGEGMVIPLVCIKAIECLAPPTPSLLSEVDG